MEKVKEILQNYSSEGRENLIPILQDIQDNKV